jgi:hypothetical protein
MLVEFACFYPAKFLLHLPLSGLYETNLFGEHCYYIAALIV